MAIGLPEVFHQIGNLKNLTFLDMISNRFIGAIPELISDCANLQFLDLHCNGLSGVIPNTLPTSLQFIDISDNKRKGPLTPNYTCHRHLRLKRVDWPGRGTSEGFDRRRVVLESVKILGRSVGGSHPLVPNVKEIVVATAG
ncbi:hypothetical protein L6452_35655 [Arctium lappa]|uniref:Uncharacterized protein n=1 Tax=Arctium lappa TaxID=4217 RepID=A0ACB8Y699_ARCLA|nr:hypothetical protein L6452_35655 [Arctium lappa]